MKKIILFILLIVLAIMLVNPIRLQFSHKHKTLAERLELSQEQIKFEQILRQENRNECKPILLKLEKNSKQYKALINHKANSKKIIAKKEEINLLSEKYNNIQKEHLQKFEKILSKEQKEKFKRIRAQLFLAD